MKTPVVAMVRYEKPMESVHRVVDLSRGKIEFEEAHLTVT